MVIDLRRVELPEPNLKPGYFFVAWNSDLISRHAWVKYKSFQGEIDSYVFRCLGERLGCEQLMQNIAARENFLPQATWLVCYRSPETGEVTDCGTIQGVGPESDGVGAIQNVGVVPEHRRQGIGRALLLKSLAGFREAGLFRVCLDVTASNEPAVLLYQSLGFRLLRTSYRKLEVDFSEST